MNKPVSYKSTVYACYVGNFVQAIVVNLTPILFIPLREQFGLSFEQLGLLVSINFVTQVAVDILFSRLVDKYGVRRFIVAAQILAVLGFVLFAASPLILPNPYIGFVAATVIFSGSGGLLELLLSPIVNAIPTDEKAAAMSMLHSFYSWGQLLVVLITTLLLLWWGSAHWVWIVLMWTAIPLVNTFVFARVPLAPMVPEEKRMPIKSLLKNGFFLMVVLGIAMGGAAELVMGQWASTFMEKAMHQPKTVGDIAGVCMFALMMGVGRALYGKFGGKINIMNAMLAGAFGAFICYLVVMISPFPVLSLLACALTGLAVSTLWPGSVVVAADKFPLAGASMFALLAAGGDTGASVGPWLAGILADRAPQWVGTLAQGMGAEQFGLRVAMLSGAVFPLIMFFCILWLKRRAKRENNSLNQ